MTTGNAGSKDNMVWPKGMSFGKKSGCLGSVQLHGNLLWWHTKLSFPMQPFIFLKKKKSSYSIFT